MKGFWLGVVLSSSMLTNITQATEITNNEDVQIYCTEQAELSGIEEMNEKDRYIKECVESFQPPADIQHPSE